MSASYADELFAVLVEEIGFDKFTKRIKFFGVHKTVLESIAIAIRQRLSDSANS
jgi:hypothetical protein